MRETVIFLRKVGGIAFLLGSMTIAGLMYYTGDPVSIAVAVLLVGLFLAYAVYPVGSAYCPKCEGTGELSSSPYEDAEECPRCDGSGRVPVGSRE